MLIAGACWLYPVCMLLTYWRDSLCLCSLPTQPSAKRRIPHPGMGCSEEQPPQISLLCSSGREILAQECILEAVVYSAVERWVSVSWFLWFSWKDRYVCHCHCQHSLHSMTRHQCPSGETVVKQKYPLFFPWGRLISKEMEIQGACWSCLVWPHSRTWWEKGAIGSCMWDICSCSWAQPWCGPAAGGGRLLLLPKRASGSVGIVPWQRM